MIDTHTHIYMPEFDEPGQAAGSMEGQCAAVDRAVAAGVGMMLMPNVDVSTIEALKTLHSLRPANTAMAMGLHPTEVNAEWKSTLKVMERELAAGECCAVGEIGIDLYWDREFEREQMDVFDAQLAMAATRDLPVIIHCRDGLDQTLEVLSGHRRVAAVFHSFGGSSSDVERILATGGTYYFGINGIVTFKNSSLSQVLPAIPAERILTETDSPYLAPVPFRGKRNESARIPLIVRTIAKALDKTDAETAEMTQANARRLFSI